MEAVRFHKRDRSAHGYVVGIDSRGDPRRCVDGPVLYEDGVRINVYRGVSLRQIGDEAPVRRRTATVQQSSRRQSVGPGIN